MNDFLKILNEWNICINDHQAESLEKYYELLITWNSKINLTSITDRKEVYIKHFADCIALCRYVDPSDRSLIDIGTGAGFPGIVLKIMCPLCHIVLADSLGKRIGFLEEVIEKLDLSDIKTIHARAEDLARDDLYRERFDIVVSRAVANLAVLSEYCLPFVNKEGIFVSYKSGIVDDELSSADNAINILGGQFDKIEKFRIPFTEYDRSLVFIQKIRETDKKYPRKAGVPSRKPL